MRRFWCVMALCLAFALLLYGCAGRGSARRYGSVNEGLSIALANADQIVEGVRSGMLRRADEITIRFHSRIETMEDIRPMVDRIIQAALEETSDPAQGDYIRCQYGGYEAQYQYAEDGDRYLYTIRITPHFYTGAAQEEEVSEEIRQILASFSFGPETTEKEKILAIYDYVRTHVEYDYMHSRLVHYHRKATAHAALFDHKAVCQGFSVLLYRMLREAGAGCRVITGLADNGDGEEYHSWNIVKLGENWYNMDVTWDAQKGTRQYFLLSDEDFTGHRRDAAFDAEEFYERYPMGEISVPVK